MTGFRETVGVAGDGMPRRQSTKSSPGRGRILSDTDCIALEYAMQFPDMTLADAREILADSLPQRAEAVRRRIAGYSVGTAALEQSAVPILTRPDIL